MSDDNIHEFDAQRERARRAVESSLVERGSDFKRWVRLMYDEVLDILLAADQAMELGKRKPFWRKLMTAEETDEFGQFVDKCLSAYRTAEKESIRSGEGVVIPVDFSRKKK